MRILALQLKRIGDLVLTTPALAALKSLPDANVTLAVDQSTASLLPAIPNTDAAIVFGSGRGWAPWQQVLTGQYDAVYDFTGTDRSALATAISRAGSRTTFAWVKKKRLRSIAYNRFIESSVRERHTLDHYMDLTSNVQPPDRDVAPALKPESGDRRPERIGIAGDYAVIHPGAARPEKLWSADRWVEVALHLIEVHNLGLIITSGLESAERSHAAEIQSAIRSSQSAIDTPPDLCAFASVLAHAAVVVSVDTAAVHLASAFQRPQVALFGPTNPFHWRPRHDRAAVISAAQPAVPMTEFTPRMKGAAMELIPSSTVIRAIDGILSVSA
jgi:ADP-heptose:LPS heptosyltransferase